MLIYHRIIIMTEYILSLHAHVLCHQIAKDYSLSLVIYSNGTVYVNHTAVTLYRHEVFITLFVGGTLIILDFKMDSYSHCHNVMPDLKV